jgi:hypothetical protein
MMRGRALSPSVRLSLSLLLIAGMLSGCGVSLSSFSLGSSSVGTSLAEEEATGSTGDRPANVSVTRAEPLDAYVVMGRRIKSCWFNATDPLLPNHVYRADVSPGGGKVQISVHQKIELGRAGATTYIIDFKRQGPATAITTENRRMPPELAAKMQYDINRSQRGASDCNRKMPAVAAAPAAAPPAKPTKQQPKR